MARKQRPDGWWYPWIFVAGMGVVVVVNGIMIYFATSTYSGLQTERHYEKGVAYNRTLEMVRRQEEMGWTSEITFVPSDSGGTGTGGVIKARITGPNGTPVPGLKVRVHLLRPTHSGHDRQIDLLPFGGGTETYAAPVTLPLKGVWDLHLVATGGSVPYQAVERIVAE